MCDYGKLNIQRGQVIGVETETIAWHPYPEWKPPKSGKYLVTELHYSDTYQENVTDVSISRYARFMRKIGGFFGGTGKVIAWAYMPEGVAVPPEEYI